MRAPRLRERRRISCAANQPPAQQVETYRAALHGDVGRLCVVAVDGFGGAGKTTLAAELSVALQAQTVHTDDFASWEEPLEWWPRLIDQVLHPLTNGQTARFQRYDWERKELGEWKEVRPRGFVILEGVSSSRDEFRPFLDFSIWVETPGGERLRRGLVRDGEDARAQWEQWMEQEEEWADRQHPKDHTDVIVSGTSHPDRAQTC